MGGAEVCWLIIDELVYPLVRLIFFISAGLMAANIIESFHWTEKMAVLARPLTRLGNMPPVTGASFSMAFVSGVSANTILAEAYQNKQIHKKELILANLFNSLPAYFLHLPTVFFITLPLIHEAAFIYIGLTLGAAVLRTFSMVILSRIMLPPRTESVPERIEGVRDSRKKIWIRIKKRFIRRMKKILKFTIPIYILLFLLHRAGIFASIETFLAEYLHFLPWITPQSISIIAFHLAAELTAGLAAAGALLQEGIMSVQETVTALLVGNIVSSPLRAFRHQFPYYAGIFAPKLAAELIIYSQSFRAVSLILVTTIYVLLA
ncbi:MAG: hypothetical protein CSB24_00205 [Deltaproteobacteria bacterium]|nr:MAG: hypothetical protein CSB24_00205 [Deltaproteobacteria bacterium]